MHPFEFNFGTGKGGPRGVRDFDLPYAYHDLNRVSQGELRLTWKTALWVNFFMGAIAGAIGFGLWVAAQYDPLARQSSLVAQIVLGLVGALFVVVFLFVGFRSLTRGRLVLDRGRRHLLFYRFWFSFRPHHRINVDDIRALSRREHHSPGSLDDPGHTYEILVAELKDGRFASIAIDSPDSIEVELTRAMAQPR